MLPAVIWESESHCHGPSVMARLQERADLLSQGEVTCTVVALLFATPDSLLIQTTEARRDYFDARTGNLWDLYFPGYCRWGRMPEVRRLSSEPDGPQFTPVAFNEMRGFIQKHGSWRYSGDSDLVLVNCYLSGGSEPLVDWASLQGGALVDPDGGYRQMSLGGVIERLTEGIEEGLSQQIGMWRKLSGPIPAPERISLIRGLLCSGVKFSPRSLQVSSPGALGTGLACRQPVRSSGEPVSAASDAVSFPDRDLDRWLSTASRSARRARDRAISQVRGRPAR
jgi:hypothetical protein